MVEKKNGKKEPIKEPLKTQAGDIGSAITAMNTAIAEIGNGTVAYSLKVAVNRLTRLKRSNTRTT